LETVPEVVASPGALTELSGRMKAPGAVVSEVLREGSYKVRFGGGTLEVTGPSGLKAGDRVRVTTVRLEGQAKTGDEAPKARAEGTGSFAAMLPLAFGGPDSLMRVEAFVGKKAEGPGKTRPVYFLLETETISLGQTQWGVHLSGRRVALQIYVEDRPERTEPWKSMMAEVEKRLKTSGFEMEHPTQWVTRPLRIPAGYGLSVRG
jgi:hypothetical protein